ASASRPGYSEAAPRVLPVSATPARRDRPHRRANGHREDQAAGMLTWPHSRFHVHTAVWVPDDDRAFATRLARCCARNPIALERLTYDRAAKVVTYRSDKSAGPTAGTRPGARSPPSTAAPAARS